MPRLELVCVAKSFGNTRALDGVSFAVEPGTVHVIAGENGAGKSTLIRVISGAIADHSGEVRLDGEPVRFADPAAAAAAGVATIHQELSLVPSLGIADNFAISAPGALFGARSRAADSERARLALAKLGLVLDPDVAVERLTLAERQLVEIARALERRARVLVMDEPTSALSEPESRRLFDVVGRLRASGTSVLFISHRLEEIYALGDAITVLRDGKSVLTARLAELSRAALVEAMLGRTPEAGRRGGGARGARSLLRVRRLSAPAPPLDGLSFELGHGEILGVAGLRGSGAGALLHALFGNLPGAELDAELDGSPYTAPSPAAALANGVALVASDREKSVLGNLAVRENGTLSCLFRERSPWIDRARERALVATEAGRVRLKAPSLEAPAAALSGGNQQKLALLRCLLVKPRLLLLDDPTRGVDLGAKADLYALFRQLADAGTSLVVHSSELDELVLLCDRVVALFRGRAVATLAGERLERARLLELVMGVAA